MKISRLTTLFSVLLVCIYFFVSSCKKKDEVEVIETITNNPTAVIPIDSSHQTTRSTDATNLQGETSQAMDDANAAMGDVSTTRSVTNICGLYSIDSSTTATTGLIILHYDGTTNCYGKKKSGAIRIQLPTSNGHVVPFSTPNVTATITFDNYKVTTISTGNYVTLAGSISMKNLTSNAFLTLFFLNQPVYHSVRMNVSAQFSEGGVITSATWNAKIKRTLTFAANSNKLNLSFSGDSLTTINTDPVNLAFWGTNRFGEAYTIDMPEAFSYDISNNNNCTFVPLTGEFHFRWSTHLLKLEYGRDYPSGNVATGCPTGYKLSWVNSQNQPAYIVLPYY
jgi:hypothetical protein